jgi:hypothetical protein
MTDPAPKGHPLTRRFFGGLVFLGWGAGYILPVMPGTIF